VNLPQTATVEDIAEAYIQAWQCGVKALAIYRDGSKTAQALRTDAQKGIATESIADAVAEAVEGMYTQEQLDSAIAKAVTKAKAEVGPARKRMPVERQSITHKFSIGGHEGYITAGVYDDGSVGEIFLTDVGKEGSALRGMMNSFATAISIALQYGVPLETLVQKFSYMRFDPEGITQNPEIPFAKSMPDYIMRWLASRFLDTDTQEELGILTPEVRARKMAEETALSVTASDTAGPSNGGHASSAPAATSSPADAATDTPTATSSSADASADAPAQAPDGAPEAQAGTPGVPTVAGSQPATTRAAADALTDKPPVVPARLAGLDLGPACNQCGGMMQRTGSCYTCSSCGNNTGCG
jgi:ribonucleoside-diphosphate reductase alpha chain